MAFNILWKRSAPFLDQKPCSSDGLVKKVTVFQQPNYLENYIQSIFCALGFDKVHDSTIIVATDGRYFSKEAIQTLVRIAAGNQVKRVWIGEHGLLSTPASSAILRERIGFDGVKAIGAFIFTACRNLGGPHEDFGIRFSVENGGPAADSLLHDIFHCSKLTTSYHIAVDLPDVDLSKHGVTTFDGPGGQFDVEIISSTDDYIKLTKSIFDFQLIKQLISSSKFSFCYDALNGVSGIYADKIFIEELGADKSILLNCIPKEDFGGCHPNPNLTYAKKLAARMGLGKLRELEPPEFGAAVDADGDHYIIFGKEFFVTPSDSIAIIAANAAKAIPYFASGLKGVARTITTSAALDAVARDLHVRLYEVPRGPKHTAKLMDAGYCSIYGEESFSIVEFNVVGFGMYTGSDNIREKDGIWGVLAWLSILALRNKDRLESVDKLISIKDIVFNHWYTYGRYFFTCYEYQNINARSANEFITHLAELQHDVGSLNELIKGISQEVSFVIKADEFEYKDPVDGFLSSKQGIRFIFDDGSRLVFTITVIDQVTSNICIYIERHEKDKKKISMDVEQALAPLVEVATKMSNVENFTDRVAIIVYPDIAPLPSVPHPRLISNEMKRAIKISTCYLFEQERFNNELIKSVLDTLTSYTWISYNYLRSCVINKRKRRALKSLLNICVEHQIFKCGEVKVKTCEIVEGDGTYTYEMHRYKLYMYMLDVDKVRSLFTKKMAETEGAIHKIESNTFFKCQLCNRRCENSCCEKCGHLATSFYGQSEDEDKKLDGLKKEMKTMKEVFDVFSRDEGLDGTEEHEFLTAIGELEMHLYDELLEKIKKRSPRLRQPGLVDICEQIQIVNPVQSYGVAISNPKAHICRNFI